MQLTSLLHCSPISSKPARSWSMPLIVSNGYASPVRRLLSGDRFYVNQWGELGDDGIRLDLRHRLR